MNPVRPWRTGRDRSGEPRTILAVRRSAVVVLVCLAAAVAIAVTALAVTPRAAVAPDAERSPAVAESTTVAPSSADVGAGGAASAEPASATAPPPPEASKEAGGDTSNSAPTPTAAAESAIVRGSVDRTSLALTATYTVRATLGWSDRRLRVATTIHVRNTSGGGIDRLELNTVAARLGSMRLGTVTVDGTRRRATVSDQTITVPLGGVLPARASTVIRVAYAATLRSTVAGTTWLFTQANGIVGAYRWIPWISRATSFDRPNHGDPFVTPVSPDITVTIASDRVLRYATTGVRVLTSVDGRSQTFHATNVRDFVLTAAPDYRWLTATVGRTTVRVAYRPGAPASAMLAAARRAIRRMSALLVPYPYRIYTVAQSPGGFGMEGPQIAWIPTGIAAANVAYLVTHETAHQWFYGLVGNDQSRQPWVDEAAADFLARYVLASRRSSRCAQGRLDLTIYRYPSTCYYEVVYIQGGNLIDDLRRRLGSTLFWTTMREYVVAHRYGLVGNTTLLDALDAASPRDLSRVYRSRFPSAY